MDLSLSEATTLFASALAQNPTAFPLAALAPPGSVSGLSGQDPIQAMKLAIQRQSSGIVAEAAQPQVSRDIQAFTAAVRGAKTIQQLLSNPAVMKVLLTANGLGDQIDYPALAAKALQSDPANPGSLVNRLSDTRWKAAAQTYQFATKGLAVIQDPRTIATLTNAYAEIRWRQSLDAATPGLSNALTFRAEAAQVRSVDQILGDPVLREVVTSAFGIPEQIAFQPLEAQEAAITTHLPIAQLQDPRFVDTVADRYLLAKQSNSATAAPQSSLEILLTRPAGLNV